MRIKYRQGEPRLKSPHGYYEYSEHDRHNVHCLRDLRYSRNNVARLLNLSHSYVSRFFYDDTYTSHTPDNHYDPSPIPPELARLKESAFKMAVIVEKAQLADFRKHHGHDPLPGLAHSIPARLFPLPEDTTCERPVYEYEVPCWVEE